LSAAARDSTRRWAPAAATDLHPEQHHRDGNGGRELVGDEEERVKDSGTEKAGQGRPALAGPLGSEYGTEEAAMNRSP